MFDKCKYCKPGMHSQYCKPGIHNFKDIKAESSLPPYCNVKNYE